MVAAACHNCRRKRLKCDRSLPQCLKCMKTGQECLGYQRLFRWDQGIASRGKMTGMTFEDMTMERIQHGKGMIIASVSRKQLASGKTWYKLLESPTDPLVQDLNHASRKYLLYFASHVCKDFVLYDIPKHNPFRELIPLTHQHPVLLQIIIANSALHMSNSWQKSLLLDTSDLSQQSESYKDALAAKQQALYLLKSALINLSSVHVDVALAVVLLFIEFELIDTGRDNWRYHINGARTMLETLCGSSISAHTTISPLRRCLISNLLIFDILGSALTNSNDNGLNDTFSNAALSLVQDAEGNHCSSFPTALLQLVRTGAHLLSQPKNLSSSQQALLLLNTAQSFNPLAWATKLQPLSPATDDIHDRTRVASAHRAAVCIYLSRVVFSLDSSTTQISYNLEPRVGEIITQLSSIRPSHDLFKAITWPAFIAGAETNDSTSQEWVRTRFQELWEIEPWGLIRGALGVLERLWLERCDEKKGNGDWIRDLRGSGVDWLVL